MEKWPEKKFVRQHRANGGRRWRVPSSGGVTHSICMLCGQTAEIEGLVQTLTRNGVSKLVLEVVHFLLPKVPFLVIKLLSQARRPEHKSSFVLARTYSGGFLNIGLNCSVLAYPACLGAAMVISCGKQAEGAGLRRVRDSSRWCVRQYIAPLVSPLFLGVVA